MADGTARIGRRRWLTLTGGLVGSGLLGACGLATGGAPASEEITIPVQRGDVEATISASGSAVARADTTLSFAQSGTISAVLVKPGERVRAGQALVQLDDGVGFDPAATGGGLGLGGMRDRATQLGGRLTIDSQPGAGTRVRAEVAA
jgi:hypothetical protein